MYTRLAGTSLQLLPPGVALIDEPDEETLFTLYQFDNASLFAMQEAALAELEQLAAKHGVDKMVLHNDVPLSWEQAVSRSLTHSGAQKMAFELEGYRDPTPPESPPDFVTRHWASRPQTEEEPEEIDEELQSSSTRRPWTEKEEATLKAGLAGGLSSAAISKLLKDRTPNAVRKRKSQMQKARPKTLRRP